MDTIEIVEPPPADLKLTFKTVQGWLISICDSERPERAIKIYSLGLFESPNDPNYYVLYMAGINKSDNKETIDFKPSNMYFKVPESEYKGLDREELVNRLTNQILDFTKTKKFENSFLSEADSIIVKGKLIWSK